MENLEEVVQERNRAYWELEVGESGEAERMLIQGSHFGWDEGYTTKEHAVPYELNEEHKEMVKDRFNGGLGVDATDFYRKYREIVYHQERSKKL